MSEFFKNLKNHDRKVPLLRGRVYFLNYFMNIYTLYQLYSKRMRPETRMSIFIGVITSIIGTTITCMYHNKELDVVSRNMYKRIDYAVIFLLVVTAYFPLYIYFIRDDFSLFFVLFHWVVTLTGVFSSLLFNFIYSSKWIRVLAFSTIGFFNYFVPFKLYKEKMYLAMFDVTLGSFVYLSGGIVYAKKAPNLIPGIFEHHELPLYKSQDTRYPNIRIINFEKQK